MFRCTFHWWFIWCSLDIARAFERTTHMTISCQHSSSQILCLMPENIIRLIAQNLSKKGVLTGSTQPRSTWVQYFRTKTLQVRCAGGWFISVRFSKFHDFSMTFDDFSMFHDFPCLFQKILFFHFFQTLWEPCYWWTECDQFTHVLLNCFKGTRVMKWLLKYQWRWIKSCHTKSMQGKI